MAFPRLLLIAGVLMSAGFACFIPFDPLNKHVPQFLTVYGFLFGMFLWTAKNVRRAACGVLAPALSTQHAALIFGFALLFRLLMLQTTPSLSDDIYRYVWDGRVQQAGINPYRYPPAAIELSDL